MSLRNLRILAAVSREGSFAAAADRLGLTQSAVSLQIKKLEEELGEVLFERTGRSPRLNPNGRLVVERAREILTIYDGIRDELASQSGIRGVLSLGVVPTVITGPLPPVLGRLREQYQELHVRLQCSLSAELVNQVNEGSLDAALTTEPPFAVPPGYEWRPYDSEPFFVVAPKGAAEGDANALFARYPFVRFDRTAWAGALVDGSLMAQGIHPQEVVELDSLEAALGLVDQGLGIAVVPLNKVRLAQAGQRFALQRFGTPPLSRRVGMYQRCRHPRRVITDVIFEELSREAK